MTTPRIYSMRNPNAWGNTLFWWRAPGEDGRGEIHGHQSPRPRPGDQIVCPMQSGRDAIFEVQAEGNTYPHDPPDQFFVSVMFAGYEDERVPESPRVEPAPPSCPCPTNEAGDICCHVCGERVNKRCWKCGTPRGEGPCPSQSTDLSEFTMYGIEPGGRQ